MNRHVQLTVFLTAILILAGLFSSCPMLSTEPGTGDLTINLPGGNVGRALTDTQKASLHYTVTLTSSRGEIVTAEGSAGKTLSIGGLLPGDWTVEVSGYLPDKTFAGYGLSELAIASGKNRTRVTMHEVVTDLNGLETAITSAPSGSTLVIGADITMNDKIEIDNGSITLKSAGNYTLRRGSKPDEFFKVDSGNSLTLAADGKNTLTLDGGSTSGNNPLIIAAGSLELGRGTILQNNKASSNGGAISIEGSNIEVTISGAVIRENSSSGNGGAISVTGSDSEVIINDGRIYNNEAVNGGAISVTGSDSGVIIKDGRIYNNSASQEGGGIYLYAGGCSMYGGHICGNHADANGGGAILGGSAHGIQGSPAAEIKGNTRGTGPYFSSNLSGASSGDDVLITIGGEEGDNDICSEGYSWP